MENLGTSMWPGWDTVQLIGRGSFGAVYEIERKVFDETEKAALKVISIPQNDSDIEELYSDGYDDESITNTFKSHLKSIVAEYSLMRKMNGCSNIVNCDDVRYIQHDDGIGWDIFIKMELLTPLTKAVATDCSEATVIKIAKDMCVALELCKKHEIVHRDIKPQNIFVSPNVDYKLGDFGIAKTVEKTMGGTKIGTYKYMAPEVYHYQPYGHNADIYSLGLVLYWLLNERRMPFMPLPPEKLRAGIEEQARNRRLSGETLPEPAHGSKELRRIVLKACAYDPKMRYQTAKEMLQDIDNLLGIPVKMEPPKPVPPAPEPDPMPSQEPEEDVTVGPVLAKKQAEDIKPKIQNVATVQKNNECEQRPNAQEQERKCTGIALPNGSWECACGRTNAAYVSSCACGINKRDIILMREQPKEAQTVSNSSVGRNGFWTCSCGRTNASYVSSCACGANKRDFEGSGEQMVRTVEKKAVQLAKKQVASSSDTQKKFPDESWKRSEAAHRAWLKSLEDKQ